MMVGMAALVRAIQEVELSDDLEHELGFELPLDHHDECPHVEHHPCAGPAEGAWEQLPDSPIFIVHAALLNTGKVLLWSGTAEVGDPLESRVWDPLPARDHADLRRGPVLQRACVPGRRPPLRAGRRAEGSMGSTHIFDPVSESGPRSPT